MVDTCIEVFGISGLIPSKVARVFLKAQCAVAEMDACKSISSFEMFRPNPISIPYPSPLF